MGSPEYPDEQNDFKPPATNSLPMHGLEENSDSDENEAPNNDTLMNLDPYAGYQQLNLEDLPDGPDDDDDEDSTNDQVFSFSGDDRL